MEECLAGYFADLTALNVVQGYPALPETLPVVERRGSVDGGALVPVVAVNQESFIHNCRSIIRNGCISACTPRTDIGAKALDMFSTLVGLGVPNCELFAGRSRFNDSSLMEHFSDAVYSRHCSSSRNFEKPNESQCLNFGVQGLHIQAQCVLDD